MITVTPTQFNTYDSEQPCKNNAVTVRVPIQFDGTNDVEVDLSALQSTGHFNAAQTIFVNNVKNAQPVTVTCEVSNQQFQVPIGGFIYMPLLQPNPPKIILSCTAAITIYAFFCNFFLPPVIWGPSLGGGTGTNIAETPVDHSGTIAVGGTAQIAIPANLARKGFMIGNPDTNTDTLYFKLGVGGGYYPLLPGAIYETGVNLWFGDIYVKMATNADPFTATEGI